MHLQGDFSGGRSMFNCRCTEKCLSYQVCWDDLCSKLCLWNIAERCFYCWSSVCGGNNDSECILLHVFLQGYCHQGSSQNKSYKFCWDDWLCLESRTWLDSWVLILMFWVCWWFYCASVLIYIAFFWQHISVAMNVTIIWKDCEKFKLKNMKHQLS